MVLAKKIKTYEPRADRKERIRSALEGVKVILSADLILLHKKELLSILIWKLTEVDGKYNCRYVTRGVLENPENEIQHEHVYTRKELIEELIESPENYKKILEKAIGCIILKDEHEKLSAIKDPSIKGWARYKIAKLVVIDRLAKLSRC